jgi:hypothetical protein
LAFRSWIEPEGKLFTGDPASELLGKRAKSRRRDPRVVARVKKCPNREGITEELKAKS